MVSDPVPNKSKRSACSTVQLSRYLETIKQVLDGIGDGDSGDEQDIPDLRAQVVDKIETQLAQAKCISSSSFTKKIPTTSKITERPGLSLKPSWETRVQDIMSVGSDNFMSAHTFYALLSMLSSLIPSNCKASARSWADIFLYRASAMLIHPRRMVLTIDHSDTTSTSRATLAGHITYNAAIARDSDDAALMLGRDSLDMFPHQPRLAISWSRKKVPQSSWMITYPEKPLLRGTLTNGFIWIFIIVYLDDAPSAGGTYRVSVPVSFAATRAAELYHVPETDPAPNLISGILTHWLEHSFDDIGEDDWFRARKRGDGA
ncbi:hypothetical protein BDN71DRAFT_1510808 [Pleurotus eryngii]|uniref:Uncharacterized protein n=1 Tax=Pleurotus eryngii TaxID=5323 RepID=A0A9P6D4P5_PLEER|nr:hypothetical protein BDN71DRAFT_1510808 [Pleurotus eryngii]